MDYTSFDEELRVQDINRNKQLKRELKDRYRAKKKNLKLQREVAREIKKLKDAQE